MFVSSVRIAYRCMTLTQCRNPRQGAPGWSRCQDGWSARLPHKVTDKSLIGIVPLMTTPIHVLIAMRSRSFRTSRANCSTTSCSLDLSSLFPVAVAVCFSYDKSDGAASLSTPPLYCCREDPTTVGCVWLSSWTSPRPHLLAVAVFITMLQPTSSLVICFRLRRQHQG